MARPAREGPIRDPPPGRGAFPRARRLRRTPGPSPSRRTMGTTSAPRGRSVPSSASSLSFAGVGGTAPRHDSRRSTPRRRSTVPRAAGTRCGRACRPETGPRARPARRRVPRPPGSREQEAAADQRRRPAAGAPASPRRAGPARAEPRDGQGRRGRGRRRGLFVHAGHRLEEDLVRGHSGREHELLGLDPDVAGRGHGGDLEAEVPAAPAAQLLHHEPGLLAEGFLQLPIADRSRLDQDLSELAPLGRGMLALQAAASASGDTTPRQTRMLPKVSRIELDAAYTTRPSAPHQTVDSVHPSWRLVCTRKLSRRFCAAFGRRKCWRSGGAAPAGDTTTAQTRMLPKVSRIELERGVTLPRPRHCPTHQRQRPGRARASPGISR